MALSTLLDNPIPTSTAPYSLRCRLSSYENSAIWRTWRQSEFNVERINKMSFPN